MDFFQIKEREIKKGELAVYPDYRVVRSKDLMVRGKSFYAIWDEAANLWSTDEYDVQRLVDEKIDKHEIQSVGVFEVHKKFLGNFSSSSWLQFRNYMAHLSDSSVQLDENLTFSNTEVKKTDYVSRRLPYPLIKGDISAWDELVSVLYEPEERMKIEWAIGAVVSGDSKRIQKFLVLYGPGGTGKSTILDIIARMFVGYTTTFEANALTSGNNAFATEVFKDNPLVGIQHDGDLSKIADNSKLNSIVAHEDMTMNEKYKPSHTSKINAFLFMGTNKPVKITDAKSGLIRRLIDVQPTGNTVSPRRYQVLVSQIEFELGAIAYHCLETYREMGRDYYSGYRPVEMMLQTDVFFNYIEAHYDTFKEQDGTTLNQAYDLYKVYCEDSNIEYRTPKYKFREELKNYFDHFDDRATIDDVRVRSWFSGFNADRFKIQIEPAHAFSLVMDDTVSLLDERYANQPAQYSKADGTPRKYWTDKEVSRDGKLVTPSPSQVVSTVLSDLNTNEEHYVKPPLQDIVIDFDLKDSDGNKSAERNLEAASQWPSTYAEFSKSEAGIHLHYEYEGDVNELSRIYDDGIEIKVFVGDSSLRRKLSRCNNIPVAKLSSGLPLKEKKVMNGDSIKSEKSLRDLINRNLRKEIHDGTKPSMDFIHKILEDAYASGLTYDVTDMRNKILAFGNNSTNQALYCLKLVQSMSFKSESSADVSPVATKDDRVVLFDVEVFPNLFIVCWKYEGSPTIVRMINPSPQEVESLMAMKLVGFNCRRYDNHILYGRYMGYDNEALYKLSKKIIDGVPNALFGEAYNISYADIYEFSSKRQGLKKWEIELDIHHQELGYPWDEPVDKSLWTKVAEYCENDVRATEAVWEHLRQDFVAREILSDLSGLSLNHTTQQHASQIIFGSERRPQGKFVYTDLSEMFPGYVYERGKSTYRDEETGEGGYVYGEPGMYTDVALLDIVSMHPTSIEALDLFGEYTENFSQLKRARVAIKHGDYDSARKMLGGKLARHLKDEDQAGALSDALKLVINIVYGLTSAKFDNSFKDPRNIDNIVAKRGALFMIDLKHFVQSKGFHVVHIKTDSIKIANATQKILDLVMEFGEEYGYTFEHEGTFDKFCLLNDAVYVGHMIDGRKPAHWTSTGAAMIHPYVFKKMFSGEEIVFRDLCETKQVTTALYLDFTGEDEAMALTEEKLHFVGKTGSFCPIKPGCGGGLLLRQKKEGDGFSAASGTTGFRWLESEMVAGLEKQDDIDMSYFERLYNSAAEAISKFGDFEWFKSTPEREVQADIAA